MGVDRSAATTEPRDNPPVRGRILSVTFPLSQTGDERDVEIQGYGLSPLVGGEIAWTNHEGSWRGTVGRVELRGESQWTAWGKVRRV